MKIDIPKMARDHQHALLCCRTTIDVLQSLLDGDGDLADAEHREATERLLGMARQALALSHAGWGTSPDDTPEEVEAQYRERYRSRQ